MARALPASDPGAHVFLEDRIDHRMTVGSLGPVEVRTTRIRGMAVAGRRSVHRTDTALRLPPAEVLGDDPGDDKWVVELQGEIERAGASVSAGLRPSSWIAHMVSFRQNIWVGLHGGETAEDSRQGCRISIRAQFGGARPSEAVEDLVLRAAGPWPIVEAFQKAFDRAEAKASIGEAPSPGPATIVLAAGAGGVVAHELVGHALEADVVLGGGSWLGERELPGALRPVTVVDDPRRGRGAWSIDDEGIPSRETVLVDNGRKRGLLIDRSTGELLAAASTGHGRRSTYLDPVRPRMGCTFIQNEDDDPLQIVRETPAGLFIRRLATGHTDTSTGRATFIVSDADRIVRGRLAGPVSSFVLELDGPRAWSSIDRVAGDLVFDTSVGSCARDGQPLAVSVGAPTIRIGVATVRS